MLIPERYVRFSSRLVNILIDYSRKKRKFHKNFLTDQIFTLVCHHLKTFLLPNPREIYKKKNSTAEAISPILNMEIQSSNPDDTTVSL